MNGGIIFALLFLVIAVFGAWICVFLEYGGLDEIINKLFNFVYSKIDENDKDI